MSTARATAAGPLYKPAVALDFFKTGGKPERIPAGETIFAEGKKGLLFARQDVPADQRRGRAAVEEEGASPR